MRGLLGLKLDNGGLFLQILLQFLIGAGLAGIRQADDGQAAGTLPDQLGQDTGQFDAFEDGAACVDAHRDAVVAEGDRLFKRSESWFILYYNLECLSKSYLFSVSQQAKQV